MSWLNKYPDGGKLPPKRPKDPLRPKELGVQVQDNLRPMPLVDLKAVADYNTLPEKFTRSVVKAKQEIRGKEVKEAEIARRKALIDRSNTEGGFKNSAVAEKMRVFPNSAGGWGEVFDDYINLPRVLIGQSADALGHAKSPSEFAQAIATPLAIGAMGYSPLHTAVSIAENPIVQTIADMPKKLYNTYNFKNELKKFNAGQQTAPLVDDVTYTTLRNINKAGNIYKNEGIPLDERIYKMVGLDIPEENVIRMTGKTRQELLQDAHEFQNIKKAREENPGLDSRNYRNINLTRLARSNRVSTDESAYSMNEIFTPAEQDAMRFNLDRSQPRLSEAEIRQRMQQNLQSSHPQYGEFYLNEVLYGQTNTSRMNQMQKANNINGKVDTFLDNIKNKQFNKHYIPGVPEGVDVKSLIPSIARATTSNAEQKIKESASIFSSANKGEYFRGAQSLSDGSFPAYIRNIQREVEKGVGEPMFGGYEELNSMGFLKNAGIDNEKIAGYLNKHILDFNKATGKNLPKARIYEGKVKYPDIVLKKLEEGGTIKNWLNKY